MHLYNEKEIGAILKRTAELSKQSRPANSDGLSLAEIEQLASDAGLDADLVARAVAELSVQSPTGRKHDIFGGPLSYATDINLDVDVDPATWESMLAAIRQHFGDPGSVSTREGILEWTGTGGRSNKKAHVYVRKTGTGSRVHVFWSETSLAVPFFIPTIFALVLSLPILFDEFALGLIGIPIMVAIVGAVFMMSRFGVMAAKKHNVKKIDQLGLELTRIAYEGNAAHKPQVGRTSQDSVPTGGGGARLNVRDLDDVDDAGGEGATDAARDRRNRRRE